ncbi:hypothetical protein OS175_12790 [Marinicella sp. S1101]|uniref:hypothetical protein n=1 Tax=Marinicella marina TaxID=2996016 RepID=UPI002260BAF9|nr:hypothetical protein [Marinicella marina]MCX7554751.1 hypothetical protein [Marinicella marina]MDJ1141433.1 hypothetical protein [Marinicella marina]
MLKLIVIGLLTLSGFNAFAQDTQKDVDTEQAGTDIQQDDWGDDWGDDWDEEPSAWQHAGFLELAYGDRLDSDRLFARQQVLSEFRWHQELEYEHDAFNFNWAHDVWYDDVLQTSQFDLRELNVQFSKFGQTDFQLGRQISTWGTGDLLFINDLFPKDWVSFFAGRDDNYLKAPADALRITSYFDIANVDLVVTPKAEPDRFINGERFSLFFPLRSSQVGGGEVINPKNPSTTEIALRLFKNINGHQFALYGYHGIEKSPTGINPNGDAFFPQKNVFGASYQAALGIGIFNLEIGHHQAREDRQGNQALIPNSQWRGLVGYNMELVKKLNWGSQIYLEHTDNHVTLINNSFNPEFEPEQNRYVITNRLTYQAMQDKLTWSLFVFYSPTDEDSYWRPSVNYRHNDQWQFTLGGNLFTGQDNHTFFGQFEDASNWYTRIRYQF